jgi:hypothetical protein
LEDLDAQKLIAEIENLRASAEKSRIDAQIASESRIGNPVLRKFPVTQVTVILALVTFFSQTVQIFWSHREQVKTHEDSEWRQAIKSLSFDEKGKALPGALNVSTFYDSERYGDTARQLVAASLPHIVEPSSFNTVYFELQKHIDQTNINYLYGVNRALREKYVQFFQDERDSFSPLEDNSADFLPEWLEVNLSQRISDDRVDQKRIAQDWENEIDSSTSGLASFWRQHQKLDADASTLALRSCQTSHDLQTLMLKLQNAVIDLKRVDLSCSYLPKTYIADVNLGGSSFDNSDLAGADLSKANLSAASFRCTNIDGTNLKNVTNYEGSVWTGTDWEKDRNNLSPQLTTYLEKNFHDQSFTCPRQQPEN